MGVQLRVPFPVLRKLFGIVVVVLAVKLDHQTSAVAEEVQDVGSPRVLTAELETTHIPMPKQPPHRGFCRGWLLTHRPGPVPMHDLA